MRRLVLPAAVLAALMLAASASAHANISPPVALAKHDQVFTLAVPTEKDVATTKVELDLPAGFAIDSFVPAPGWKRVTSVTGSPASKSVTWTGGSVPSGEDAAFSFLAGSNSANTLVFTVKQTYADGSVVTWSGPETSDTPSPTVEFRSSLGGSSGAPIGVIALVLAVVALVVAVMGLLARTGGGRSLT